MFIVYHIDSTQIVKTYKKIGWAKRESERLNALDAGNKLNYSYTPADYYYNTVVGMKTVINLMTGKEIQIPTNTPRCCDPSSELYWTM